MKTHIYIITLLAWLCFWCLNLKVYAANVVIAKDSIGSKTINGKNFTLHKVAKNENLFKIANRYKTTVAQIQAYNPKTAKGLKENQILEILRSATANSAPLDKSKIKIHIVGSGQTLYALSQLYKVSIEDIVSWNNLSSEQLKEGQQLQVSPKENINAASGQKNKPKTALVPATNEKNSPTHLVEPAQTLFSIAKKYHVSVDKIKTWNGLLSDELLAGQLLIVSAEGYKDAQNAPTTALPASSTTETPAASATSTAASPVVNTLPTPATPANNSGTDKKPAASDLSVGPVVPATKISSENGYERIIETGLAEVIEQSSDTRKHLCLHRSAPIGAILQVKNESNGNVIFIRVIGRLPNTGPNERIILRVSKKAYERLNPASKRFVVEVSYPKS